MYEAVEVFFEAKFYLIGLFPQSFLTTPQTNLL